MGGFSSKYLYLVVVGPVEGGDTVDKRDLEEAVTGFVKSSELHFALHKAMEDQIDLLKEKICDLEGQLAIVRNELAFLMDTRRL